MPRVAGVDRHRPPIIGLRASGPHAAGTAAVPVPARSVEALPRKTAVWGFDHTGFNFWMKSLTSGWVQVSPWYPKSSSASLLHAAQAISRGDTWQATRTG